MAKGGLMTAISTCPSCGQQVRVPSVAAGRPRCPSCKSDLPWVVAATDKNFHEVADSRRIPVLVDLWAPWCGPCRTMSPLLERLATERAGTLKLVKVNVDESPGTQTAFRVQAIPTLVLLNDGREVARHAGAMPLAQLRNWLDSALAG